MKKNDYLTVVVENLYQSHNASSVIRTCESLGIKEIFVIQNKYKFDLDSDKSLGAEKFITINYYDNVDSCVKDLKLKNYSIVITTPHNDDFDLENLPLNSKLALVFGTEKKGISKELIDKADKFMKIPMYGFTESLNISVCVAISLNYLVNKLINNKIIEYDCISTIN